jgi:hypothetical protein
MIKFFSYVYIARRLEHPERLQILLHLSIVLRDFSRSPKSGRTPTGAIAADIQTDRKIWLG